MARGAVACGVAAIVTWRGRVLFGRRPRAGGDTAWQLPGGWIEAGESPLAAVHREVLEETGLELVNPRFVAVTSNVFDRDEHSISLYFEAECRDAASLSSNGSRADGRWEWRRWNEVGGELFLPLRLLRQTGYQPFSGVNFPTHFSF